MASNFLRGKIRGVDLNFVDHSDLTEDDHEDVRKALLDVAHRWTHIGGAFRLKRSKIKGITHPDAQECLSEVIAMWLEEDYDAERFGPPNWRWVVKAVAEEAGGSNPALAEKIAKYHSTPRTVGGDGPARVQHRSPAAPSPRPAPSQQFADPQEVVYSRDVSWTGHHAPASLPGAVPRSQGHDSTWFPNDGRVAADGPNTMMRVVYEPVLQTESNNWESVTLSFGETPIERREVMRRNAYPMGGAVHGIAIIINNQHFDTHEEREGTEIDEQNLIQTFRYLRYKVEVYRECSGVDIERIFQSIPFRDHRESDSFVCCILSHGREGEVFGCDGQSVRINEMTKMLNARNCRDLAGKPKMFFIQACRGPQRDAGVRIACDGVPVEVPNEADFFLSYATPSGQASFRDLDHGSWYVSELCQVLCRFSTYLHLNDMLTEVHGRVGRYTFEKNRQAPEITQRLQKNVYFF